MLKEFAVTILFSTVIGILLANNKFSAWGMLAFVMAVILTIQISYFITLALLHYRI
jgi:uncharacterized membrane protein YdbT with pleckstrin-like domain